MSTSGSSSNDSDDPSTAGLPQHDPSTAGLPQHDPSTAERPQSDAADAAATAASETETTHIRWDNGRLVSHSSADAAPNPLEPATPSNAPAGWYQDPQHLGQTRYWNGAVWLAPAGWYPDPDDPKSQRRWTGVTWVGRQSRHHSLIITGALVFLTLQGCATALSQAPTCNPHSPVSTPTTTPFAATSVLWLIGLVFAIGFFAVWRRHRWTPRWLPLLLIVGSVVLPLLSWVFAAASCGL